MLPPDKIAYLVIFEGYVEHDSTGGHTFRNIELYFGDDDEDIVQQIRSFTTAQQESQTHRLYPVHSYNKIEVYCVLKTAEVPVELAVLLKK